MVKEFGMECEKLVSFVHCGQELTDRYRKHTSGTLEPHWYILRMWSLKPFTPFYTPRSQRPASVETRQCFCSRPSSVSSPCTQSWKGTWAPFKVYLDNDHSSARWHSKQSDSFQTCGFTTVIGFQWCKKTLGYYFPQEFLRLCTSSDTFVDRGGVLGSDCVSSVYDMHSFFWVSVFPSALSIAHTTLC